MRGKPGGYITVKIRKANLNPTVENKDNDLWGNNMKDQIVLWWSRDDRAAEYVFSRSTSLEGPWAEIFRLGIAAARKSGAAVDITPDAMLMDLCYKIEAIDGTGKVIRRYEPICVPKWQEEGSLSLSQDTSPNLFSSFLSHGGLADPFFNLGGQDLFPLPSYKLVSFSSATGVQLASAISTTNSTQSSSQPYNTMCLSNDEFVDSSAMTYEDIQNFLEDKNSFLQGEIKDVDGVSFETAEIINFAAQTYGINPQVLLTTLQKEFGAITKNKRLKDDILKLIMGYNTNNPTTIVDQILDAAAQMRRDFDRLSNGQATASGWQVGVSKLSGEPNPGDEKDASGESISVTPANKAVAVLFTYTPWIGERWGGEKGIGGNGSFCKLWEEFGFKKEVSLPDLSLILTIFSAPNPPFRGFIRWIFVNQGEATATGFLIHIFLVSSSSGSEVLQFEDLIGSLAPGESVSFASSPFYCGSCFLRIIIDPTNVVRESNEENNTLITPIF